MRIFSKTLRKTDVEKRGVVPMEYFNMKRFPKVEGNNKVRFKVKDESGRDWNLCCYARKIGNDPNRPKHPKPALIEGWMPFVRENKLCIGDRVIIDEEQDETGLMQLRIKVRKQSSPRSPVMNKNLDGNKGSAANNNSTATLPSGNHSDTLKPDLGGTNASPSSTVVKEKIPTTDGTSQDMACYNTERPSLNLSLELTLRPTITGRTTAATSSSFDKQTPFPHSASQDMASYRTEWPSLSLSLGLTPNPTMTGGQQHVCMQRREPKTIDFLGSFL